MPRPHEVAQTAVQVVSSEESRAQALKAWVTVEASGWGGAGALCL